MSGRGGGDVKYDGVPKAQKSITADKTRAIYRVWTDVWTSSRPRSHRHKLLVHKQLTNDVVQNPARLQERCDVVHVSGVRDARDPGRQHGDVGRVACVARAEVDAY